MSADEWGGGDCDGAGMTAELGVSEQCPCQSKRAHVGHVEIGCGVTAQHDGRAPRGRGKGVGEHPSGTGEVVEAEL